MIFLIIIFGFTLRSISLNQSLWLDEATSVLAARDFSVNEILTRFSLGDFHPPLYYLLLKAWMQVFGSSEFAVRSMSVLLGVLTIWVVYAIAREIYKDIGGKQNYFPLFSALLLATAPLHIYYSQEARMYAPVTFFVSLSILFFIRIFKQPNLVNWIGWSVTVLLFIYTDYPPIFMFLAFVIYAVLFEINHLKKHLIRWFISMGSVAILFSPWLLVLYEQLIRGLSVKTNVPVWWEALGRTDFKQLLLIPIKFIIGRISSYDKIIYASSVLIAFIPYGVSMFKSFQLFERVKLLWVWLLIPITTAALLGLKFSGFSYFRLLFVLPAFYLLIAYGALSLKSKKLRMGIVSGLILVNLVTSGIYIFNPRFHREDWRSAVDWIEEHSQGKKAGTIFVSRNQRDPYFYYQKSVLAFGPEGLEGNFDTLWLARYVQPIFDPEDKIKTRIERMGYKKIYEYDFNGVVIWQYENRN